MRLSHNIASLNIYRQQSKNLRSQTIAMDRISSGKKFSNASENPKGLVDSEKIAMGIRGMQVSQRNAQDGISMMQAIDGSLNEASEIMLRIKELSVQAGGATSNSDKEIIQDEISQLIEGYDNIINGSDFNGIKILNDEVGSSYTLAAIGSNSGDVIKIPKYNLLSSTIGLDTIDVTLPGGVDGAITELTNITAKFADVRSQYSALGSRFEETFQFSSTSELSLQGSQSSISDADIAQEMIEFSRSGILIEAGNAMMVQTNRFPMEALKILENVRR